MKTLEENLREQTLTLKDQFIEMMKKWADNDFHNYENMLQWGVEEWARYLGVKTVMRQYSTGEEKLSFHDGFANTAEYAKMDRAKNNARRIVEKGKEAYIEKKASDAEKHYENSILKLANRIRKKGIDENNFEMKTSHIDVNINTEISDGNKTVNAWTIVAGGPIQRPHYRYLVK